MSTELKLKQLDMQEAEHKQNLLLGEALNRLKRNADYQLVIEHAYLEHNAIRLVHLKGDPSQIKPENQASIIKEIDAISSFAEFTRMIRRNAEQAEKELPGIEAEREFVIKEDQ